MSAATKRKHVMHSVLTEKLEVPEENQDIVRIRASVGNNLHEVETAKGEVYLVSMPTKFRRNVWVKRGDFILVEPILEGDKVRAEMVRPLSSHYIQFLRKNNSWPSGFELKDSTDEFCEGNPNRRHNRNCDGSSSTSCSSSSEDEAKN